MKKPNALIQETSPYLLQHAYNPVAWEAWNSASLKRAREEEKPMLISIGYSSCHWCHVMEHECFEDPEVAQVMNTHFVCIKVDREERPDIDHIYMDALQIMTGSGGWPLNIVALPNGKPFWGATYLPKSQWKNALEKLAELYRNEPKRVLEYAEDLTRSIKHLTLPESGESLLKPYQISKLIEGWKLKFDTEFGGIRGAPKFMIPSRLQFLMHWGELSKDSEIQNHVRKSLTCMAYGGLYDQLAGGFSRYSVDVRWHVPHFEKMLYDNAQLMSLYAQAYACYGDSLYLEIVSGILDFILQQWQTNSGGFYAAFDADSLETSGKLEEGAYYVWHEKELRETLNTDFDLFREAYNINAYGKWESNQYVLIRNESDKELAHRLNLSTKYVSDRLQNCREQLLELRAKRNPPRLDNKLILSWNGLMLSGLSDAYRYCNLKRAKDAALALGHWIETIRMDYNGNLPHIAQSANEESIGFLEDYASVIEGYIKLYGITWDISWMNKASELIQLAEGHFNTTEKDLFYFESESQIQGIRKTFETTDSVIPASNSIMGKNLFLLGHFYENKTWIDRAQQMLTKVSGSASKYSEQHSNWLQLALWLERPFLNLVICSSNALAQSTVLTKNYLPNSFLAVSTEISDLPLFKQRHEVINSKIHICTFGMCLEPVTSPEKALDITRNQLNLNTSL
ncbi:MAG: hypothetical protein RLZZ241_1397 [Bacteroidota bacterium]|jgi:uncharacterized protein YyaL (SSP411 family)